MKKRKVSLAIAISFIAGMLITGVLIVLVMTGGSFFRDAVSVAATPPALYGPHRLGDTVEKVKSQTHIAYYETVYGEFYDAWEGLDIYDSSIVGLEDISFTQPLFFGFLDNKLELVSYAVDDDYMKLIDLFVDEYGEPVVHALYSGIPGIENILIRWRYKNISATMFFELVRSSAIVIVASHQVVDDIF